MNIVNCGNTNEMKMRPSQLYCSQCNVLPRHFPLTRISKLGELEFLDSTKLLKEMNNNDKHRRTFDLLKLF